MLVVCSSMTFSVASAWSSSGTGTGTHGSSITTHRRLPSTSSLFASSSSSSSVSGTASRRNVLSSAARSVSSLLLAAALVSNPLLVVAADADTTAATTVPVSVSVPVVGGPIRYGSSSDIMKPKAHGTSDAPVQSNLLFGIQDTKLADDICNYNRHYAEPAGYFARKAFNFMDLMSQATPEHPVTFYDSVTGLPLFVAPQGRSADDFVQESLQHGWPSFRDKEVVWENVRVLKDTTGETVSSTGTHLGHNLPDRKGNRYCINLVSIAGRPSSTSVAATATATATTTTTTANAEF